MDLSAGATGDDQHIGQQTLTINSQTDAGPNASLYFLKNGGFRSDARLLIVFSLFLAGGTIIAVSMARAMGVPI